VVPAIRRLAWASALLLAAACAQLETKFGGEAAFELAGRLAARHGAESFSGNIAWRHAADGDELLITSPLGQGVARIVRKHESVVLTTAEPKEYRAADAESLTEQVLGYRLPLAGLAEWVRGRPSERMPVSRIDKSPDGKLLSLEQGGWTIDYQEYQGERPYRMRLQRPGGIELRLAISQWK
jgi:outer membrane lipoprotein LolB